MAKRYPTPKIMPPAEIRGPVSDPLSCVKVSYTTEREALDFLRRRRLAGVQEPYRCSFCHRWHLTSNLQYKPQHRRRRRRA